MERHTVSRLIGAPPGYVGYDQGGLLTDAVDQHPHAVVLLDEIEKAHPDVYNILLQVMDHGVLTDANGKKVDFRNVVLIMTTNAGASDAQRNSIGFGRGKADDEDEEAIKRLFTPEFRNRLDAVVAFKPLTPEIIRQVVQKFVMQLEAQLADRHVTIETDRRRGRLAGQERLRRALRRPAAGPGDPGAHQEAARRRDPVRQAGQAAATSRWCSRTARSPSRSSPSAAPRPRPPKATRKRPSWRSNPPAANPNNERHGRACPGHPGTRRGMAGLFGLQRYSAHPSLGPIRSAISRQSWRAAAGSRPASTLARPAVASR